MGTVTSLDTFFANIPENWTGMQSRPQQVQLDEKWYMSSTDPKMKGLHWFYSLPPDLLDSADPKTLIYQIWCFPPEVKIPATFCHISATLNTIAIYIISKLEKAQSNICIPNINVWCAQHKFPDSIQCVHQHYWTPTGTPSIAIKRR